jgi:hypothetical protein
MDALVAKLSPAHRDVDEEQYGESPFGNLDRRGVVQGMSLPRVADVSHGRTVSPSPFAEAGALVWKRRLLTQD